MSTRMSRSACLISLLLPALLGWTTANADKFDERITAPRAANAQELKTRARGYFAAYEKAKAREVGGIVRDRAAHKEWTDLRWRLSDMMDEGRSPGDLSEFGLIAREDGSYTIDLKQFPQWSPLDSNLPRLRLPAIFDAYAPELKARGFRDQDLEALKHYLDKNDLEQISFNESKPLAESFGAHVQARHRAKRSIPGSQVKAYMYQGKLSYDEIRRRWAIGLLDTLDQQRQRILESYFEELEGVQAIGPPSGNMEEKLKTFTDVFISGDYQRMLKQQELEMQK